MPEAHFPVGQGGGVGGGGSGVRNVAPPLLGNLGANKVL